MGVDECRAGGALRKFSAVDGVEEQNDQHEQRERKEGLHESLRASVR